MKMSCPLSFILNYMDRVTRAVFEIGIAHAAVDRFCLHKGQNLAKFGFKSLLSLKIKIKWCNSRFFGAHLF